MTDEKHHNLGHRQRLRQRFQDGGADARRLVKTELLERPAVNRWDLLVDYCRINLAHLPRERLHLLFLDRKNAVIDSETQGIGTVDHAPIYPRDVARRALGLNASAVITVHNHVKRKFAPRPTHYEVPCFSGKHRVRAFPGRLDVFQDQPA